MSYIGAHSYFDLNILGVKTPDWEEFYGEEQLEKDKYVVGWVKDNFYYADRMTVEGKEKILAAVKELYRTCGKKTEVILQEVPDAVSGGRAFVSQEGLRTHTSTTTGELIVLKDWEAKLRNNFLFNGNSIELTWIKDTDGVMMVTDIRNI